MPDDRPPSSFARRRRPLQFLRPAASSDHPPPPRGPSAAVFPPSFSKHLVIAPTYTPVHTPSPRTRDTTRRITSPSRPCDSASAVATPPCAITLPHTHATHWKQRLPFGIVFSVYRISHLAYSTRATGPRPSVPYIGAIGGPPQHRLPHRCSFSHEADTDQHALITLCIARRRGYRAGSSATGLGTRRAVSQWGQRMKHR